MNLPRILTFVITLYLIQMPAAFAAFVNGDLELAVPSNGTSNGWTSANIDGAGGWFASGGNPDGNFILNAAGEPGTDPTLSQTVLDLVLGQQYTVSGQYSPVYTGFGDPSAFSFGVLLDGTAILQLASEGSEGSFTDFAIAFFATSTTHTLAFAGERNSDDSSYRIDNLAISAVPLPAGLVLLLSGCVTLAGAYRSRRHD